MTQEEIQLHYNAAMDSVNLIRAGKPKNTSDEDWADAVKRNKEHLQIQITKGKDFYGNLDLTPFKDAVK
jgi:hypothetical protein